MNRMKKYHWLFIDYFDDIELISMTSDKQVLCNSLFTHGVLVWYWVDYLYWCILNLDQQTYIQFSTIMKTSQSPQTRRTVKAQIVTPSNFTLASLQTWTHSKYTFEISYPGYQHLGHKLALRFTTSIVSLIM